MKGSRAILAGAGLAAGLALTTTAASAATFIQTDYMGTLTVNPVTDTGSLSSSVTLIYQNSGSTSKLFYSFGNGGGSGSFAVTPAASSESTILNYTFNIATPVQLLYGQMVATLSSNLMPLGGGTVQLFDKTTNTALTSAYAANVNGTQQKATTITSGNIILTNTTDLYELVVSGLVGASPTRSGSNALSVQYSPSVYATAVTEPSTWALMIVGLGFMGGNLRLRNRKHTRIATA